MHAVDSGTRFVPTGQACRQLGCRKEALYRWAVAGEIKFFLTPGGCRRRAVDEFIAQRTAIAREKASTKPAASAA